MSHIFPTEIGHATQSDKLLNLQWQDTFIWLWGQNIINLMINRMLDVTKQSKQVEQEFQLVLHKPLSFV